MKSFFLLGIVFLCSVTALFSQEKLNEMITKEDFIPSQSIAGSKYSLSFGINILDNGNSNLPFNATNWSINTPFFASLERRGFSSKFSPILSFSTNSLKLSSGDKFYFSVDAAARYYFDDYIFKSDNIETFVGLGVGRFFLENKGNNTFNYSLGGRYWFLRNFGILVQGVAKAGLKPRNEQVLNLYAYNVGVVWRSSPKRKAIKEPNIEPFIYVKEKLIKDKVELVPLQESIIQREEDVIAVKLRLIKEKERAAGVITPLTAPKKIQISDVESSNRIVAASIGTRYDYTGDWYVKITNAKDNSLIIGNSLYSTYHNSINDDTMWISDFKKGVWLQCKIEVNFNDGTFTAVSQPNIIDIGSVSITEGKFEKGTGVSTEGNKVDKIYFKAQFSYDPDNILIFEGNKNTGLGGDK